MKITDSLVALDIRLLYWLEIQRQRPAILRLARGASRSGDGYIQVCCITGMVLSGSPPFKAFGLWLGVLFALERMAYWVTKNTLKRRRPPVLLPSFKAVITASDQFSFPSGHTSAAFLLVFAWMMFEPLVALMLLPWAMAVGTSRVVLGVHFPSDILAGIALALCTVYAFAELPGLFPMMNFLG